MFSLHIYLRISLLVTCIVLVAMLGVAGIASGKAIILGCFGIAGAMILIGYLVSYLNRSNCRVQLFLDAIQDNDSMLYFPENSGSEEQRRLHSSFNRINTLLTETKLESRQQELFYKALLQYIPVGIISWDKRGKINVINNTALSLLGSSFLRHIYQIEQLIPDFRTLLEEASNKGTSIIQVRRGELVRQLAISVSQVVLREEEMSILVLKDIGRELSQKEFESWDKLTHVLTHEIMNSIAPIVSLSGTLLSYFQTKGEAKSNVDIKEAIIHKTIRGLDTIKNQGQILMNFTDSYRRLSYLQPPVPKNFSLSHLIQSMQSLFHADLERQQIVLTTDLFQPEIDLFADEELLSQVFINLLKNAMQALNSEANGKIGIQVSKQGATIIHITDNGPGIPHEILEDIFIPFFTTKSSGTGIGLSLSRQIIRMHGGDLVVCSQPYNETRFTITLPHASV